MLGVLGLSPDEEAVYRLVIGRPAVAAADLAVRAALSEEAVGRALERLAHRGLLTSGSGVFCASPPAVALGSLISERREELRAAELALAAFAEEHRMAM